MFHPVLAAWKGLPNKSFQEYILIGVFGINGIIGISLPIDRLQSTDINVHDGVTSLSPNNLQFTIDQNRVISTMWSVALSPNYKKIVITYHMMVNDQQKAQEFENICSKSNNLGQLIENLGKIQLTNQADAQALHNALATIGSMATGVPAQSVSIRVPTPTPALTTVVSNQRLQQELQNLKSRLNELQRALG